MATKGSKSKPTKRKELFVGRQKELALARGFLEEARGGRGSFIAISGEPGIGKTRLAEAIATAASGRGFRVFWGQCHDGQYVPPYWPWKQLLRDLLALLPRPGNNSRNRGIATGLSEIVTGLGQGHATRQIMAKPISDQARLRIIESATSLIRIVSDRKPLLLILDNLHCADVPSLQLLEVVAREMSARSFVVVGSYREPAADTSNAFRETIGALAGQELFKSMPLLGWDEDGVSEYLSAWGKTAPPAPLVHAVLGRTEGNPLFVAEVVRLLEHKGLLQVDSAENVQAWETYIPQKVRLAILGLVQRLSAQCREAMAAAALLGREFESSLLHEIIPHDPPAVEDLLEEAIAHAMIEDEPGRARQLRVHPRLDPGCYQ